MKEKDSKSHLGKKHSEEAKRKMHGRIPWNKGLTVETDERVRKCGEKISLTLKGRPESEETKIKISQTLKGRKFSDKTKQKMSYHAKNFPSKKQLKQREKFGSGIYQMGKTPWNKGKPFLQGKENPHFGKPNEYYKGHGRSKRKDLNNMFFKSKWEANFARVLNYWKIPWEYEKTRFNLGDCTYCPDFKIFDPEVPPYFVEVIGFFDDIHKKKLKLFQEKYPNEQIQIIHKIEYEDLKHKFSNIIESWE